MADELEQARGSVRDLTTTWPLRAVDAALERLEAAIRKDERGAVVQRLASRDWRGETTIDLDTLDTIIDFILEGGYE